jgi:protein-disulfide isomerase
MESKFSFTLSVPMAILIGAVLITGAVLYNGLGGRGASVVTPTETPAPTPIADPSILFGPGDAVLGNANAKVTIVEFSDFECPYCRSFFIGAYPELKKNYIDTGKVKLVFRHFPLSFHVGARPAALAAQCAGDQGKFWEMHDKIFSEQQKQEADKNTVTRTVSFEAADVNTWAKSLGLNMTTYTTCMTSEKYGKKVDADIAAGTTFGVSGTPTFFVNGQFVLGAQPFSEFKKLIDDAL